MSSTIFVVNKRNYVSRLAAYHNVRRFYALRTVSRGGTSRLRCITRAISRVLISLRLADQSLHAAGTVRIANGAYTYYAANLHVRYKQTTETSFAKDPADTTELRRFGNLTLQRPH